jgi:hypothetical protein
MFDSRTISQCIHDSRIIVVIPRAKKFDDPDSFANHEIVRELQIVYEKYRF